jgi:hypothetical protein
MVSHGILSSIEMKADKFIQEYAPKIGFLDPKLTGIDEK